MVHLLVHWITSHCFSCFPVFFFFFVPRQRKKRGLVLADGVTVAPKAYAAFYAGDYDSAAWVYNKIKDLFDDGSGARGQVPIGWALDPELSLRFPPAFDYVYSRATPTDVFTSGDSGAGYTNPSVVCMSMDGWMFVSVCIYVYMSVCLCVCMHVCVYACACGLALRLALALISCLVSLRVVSVCLYACVSVCMSVSMGVHAGWHCYWHWHWHWHWHRVCGLSACCRLVGSGVVRVRWCGVVWCSPLVAPSFCCVAFAAARHVMCSTSLPPFSSNTHLHFVFSLLA